MRIVIIAFAFALMSTMQLAAETNSSNLPKPVKDYFGAIAKSDRQLLSSLYSEKASILEVNRTISGNQAILHWADNEVFGGKYKILRVISADTTQSELIVEFTPKGSASGFRANYKFQITGAKISHMNLQYAD